MIDRVHGDLLLQILASILSLDYLGAKNKHRWQNPSQCEEEVTVVLN